MELWGEMTIVVIGAILAFKKLGNDWPAVTAGRALKAGVAVASPADVGTVS